MFVIWWVCLVVTCAGYGMALYQANEEGNIAWTSFLGAILSATMKVFLFYYSYQFLIQ